MCESEQTVQYLRKQTAAGPGPRVLELAGSHGHDYCSTCASRQRRLRSVLHRLHVVLALLLVELAFLLRRRVLVLLILGNEIVKVGLSFRELHLVHPLASVPMEKRLAAEHPGVLLRNALEHLLDGSAVTHERNGHLQSLGWDVADAALHIVGDPLDKAGTVL